MRNMWKLISPFWRSEEKYKAYALFSLLILFSGASVYGSVLLNQWGADFFNALQEFNKALFIKQSIRFLGLIVFAISVFMINYYVTRILIFHWRRWLTEHYISRWLSYSNHYRLKYQKPITDNPDQRISQDLASFSEGILSLFFAIFKECLSLVVFAGILWTLSGPLNFTLFGKHFTLHGYLVWAALLYAVFGTGTLFKIGKPLVKLDFEQEKYEANFRYALVRFREKGEEIAIYRGENIEKEQFKLSFKDIVNNFYNILKQQMYINCFQNFYNNVTTIFPFVAASPLFFAKIISFGVLMQIRGAFAEVQDSFSILVKNFQAIASLRATTLRLIEFTKAIETLETQHTQSTNNFKTKDMTIDLLQEQSSMDVLSQKASSYNASSFNTPSYADKPIVSSKIVLNSSLNSHLHLENITLVTPLGNELLSNVNLRVQLGERVLMMGRSGLGKTTILRAIAGVWPFGSGALHLPAANMLFVPQRPYLPLGTLRDAVLYPKEDLNANNEDILCALQQCRLDHLYEHLDEVQDWSQRLSLGEQQRIIFVRAILQKPDWIIMDEPTSAMDKETESTVYRALFEFLPNITLITIGHSPSLKAYHSRVIDMDLEKETESTDALQTT